MSLFIITISYTVLTRVQQLSCDGGLALTMRKQKCEKKKNNYKLKRDLALYNISQQCCWGKGKTDVELS